MPLRHDPGVGSWIERLARTRPDQVALIHGDTGISYASLAERVRRLANGLRDVGVERGARVVWLGANHPAFLEALFATATIGAVLAPINHRLDHDAISNLVQRYSARVAVVDQASAAVHLPGVVSRVVVGGGSEDGFEYEALIEGSGDAPVTVDVALDELCLLHHTSGTSGAPKGVMLTHGNVAWNVFNMWSIADLSRDDVTIAVAPFFRTGGVGVNILPVLAKGGTVVIPERSTPDELLELMARHAVTVGFANPDVLDALTHAPAWTTTDMSALRLLITGGAPVPEHLIQTYMDRGITFLQGYGLSEAAPLVLLLDPESALRKVGSAGRPPLFVEVRLVGGDGKECEPGTTGEMLVRGPNVMAGYWDDRQATTGTIDANGWLRTGDAARCDPDGFFWIVDRVGDAYSSSGQVVYPGDVERVLAEHPAVAEAAAVARGDGADGADIFVVLAPGARATAEELLEHCRARLPDYAVPRAVVFTADLPRSTVGKLLRHVLANPNSRRAL